MSKLYESQPTEDDRETQDFTTLVPTEILGGIFRLLDKKSLLKARQACRRWKAVGSAVPIADRQGRLIVPQLPFRTTNTRQSEADQVSLALQSILPEEGEEVKLLSFTSGRWRRSWINKTTLELIAKFCPNLISLHMSLSVRWLVSDVNEFNWASMSQLTQLSEFQLEDNGGPVTNEQKQKFIVDFAQLLSTWPLAKLTLSGCQRCPTFIASHLTDLSLHTSIISNAQLEVICRHSSKISTLTLASPQSLTDFTTVSTLSDLQQLKVESCHFSNDHLKQICIGCPQLVRLDLGGCDRLTPFDGLASLQHLKSLTVGTKFGDTHVNLMPQKWCLDEFRVHCDAPNPSCLRDVGLSTLSQKCPGLKTLCLQGCPNITDASVSSLVINCPQLESVDLRGTRVSHDSPWLLRELKFLRNLRVPLCYQNMA